MEIDPTFQQARARSRKRRARRRTARLGLIAGLALGVPALAGALWLGFAALSGEGGEAVEVLSEVDTAEGALPEGEAGEALVQVDTGAEDAPPVRVATAFTDIAGDPMILNFGGGGAGRVELEGPATLDETRVGPPRPGRLILVRDELVVREQRLMTSLPSSREDFAFFQAQRAARLDAPAQPVTEQPGTTETGEDLGDLGDSWGESLESGAEKAAYTETRIENTTSLTYLRPESRRTPIYEDVIILLETPRKMEALLQEHGFDEAGAQAVTESATAVIPELGDMKAGAIFALRMRPAEGEGQPELLQLSLYGPERYIGSLARLGDGRYLAAADPWIDTDLRRLAAQRDDTVLTADQNYRLLDAFYSAAIRNGVPTGAVGETIVMMSQAFDLEVLASPEDRMALLYAPEPGPFGGGPGQVLYAAITGASGDRVCYISQRPGMEGGFDCYSENAGPKLGALGGNMVTPVSGGTLSSGFGPRNHPILKQVKLHAGVDWAAPTGTPVHAAFAGTVSHAGNGGGYGNLVIIDHPDGRQTRYAHLDKFAPLGRSGAVVQAGDLIGYVGTTGRSTGPHLHFEVRVNGRPVDPFGPEAAGGQGAVVMAAVGSSSAAEALTNQIIKVESGGNAAAKNPLSTATGLGQFIESTWLRMMNTYRPDLASTMSRADLLALRTDPTLSREMVMNLARENETYLRARGHEISAGRLYLAHFLGPEGAHVVLSANTGDTILNVMGASVVRANPFLKNYTVADLRNWADRKMGGAGGTVVAAVPVAQPMPPEVLAYKKIIDEILDQAT